MKISSLKTPRQGGGLTSVEVATLQQVANESGLPFSVVGERGRHAGRNINTALPFGEGPHERSPIEFAFPAEYDLLTSGGFTERLYNSLDLLFGAGAKGYHQTSHMWPVAENSIDFYPKSGQRVILSARPRPAVFRSAPGSD
jgi:hypothetical protein